MKGFDLIVSKYTESILNSQSTTDAFRPTSFSTACLLIILCLQQPVLVCSLIRGLHIYDHILAMIEQIMVNSYIDWVFSYTKRAILIEKVL